MKRTSLKKASKAYAKALRTYRRYSKPMWLENHPHCEFHLEGDPADRMCGETYGCTVHHMMGRGKYLNDMRYFMTLCMAHHAFVETYKREARKLGYILYK